MLRSEFYDLFYCRSRSWLVFIWIFVQLIWILLVFYIFVCDIIDFVWWIKNCYNISLVLWHVEFTVHLFALCLKMISRLFSLWKITDFKYITRACKGNGWIFCIILNVEMMILSPIDVNWSIYFKKQCFVLVVFVFFNCFHLYLRNAVKSLSHFVSSYDEAYLLWELWVWCSSVWSGTAFQKIWKSG